MFVDNPEGVRYFKDLLEQDPKLISDKIILRGFLDPPRWVSEKEQDDPQPEQEILCFADTPFAVFIGGQCIRAKTNYPHYQIDTHYCSLLSDDVVQSISPEEMLDGLALLDQNIFRFLLFHLDLLN